MSPKRSKDRVVLRVVRGEEPGSNFTFVRVVEHGGNARAIAASATKLGAEETEKGQLFAHGKNRDKKELNPPSLPLPAGTLVTCKGIGQMRNKEDPDKKLLPHLEDWSVFDPRKATADEIDDAHEAANAEAAAIQTTAEPVGPPEAPTSPGAAAEGNGKGWMSHPEMTAVAALAGNTAGDGTSAPAPKRYLTQAVRGAPLPVKPVRGAPHGTQNRIIRGYD